MLDEDSTVMMGDFCEEILRHPFYQTLVDQFELSCCQQILASSKDSAPAREAIWAEFNGARAFMTFMSSFVEQAKKVREARDLQAQEDQGNPDELLFGEADYEEF